MNILFVGHLYENSGWGNAAKLYLKALIATGYNIVARSIRVCDPVKELEPELQACLDKKMPEKLDYCIQNILPTYMTKVGGCTNIGLIYTETTNIEVTPWAQHLKLMDMIWCPNMQQKSTLSFLPQKKHYVPCPVEMVDPTSVPRIDIPNNGKYTFYFIGDLIERKNVNALIRAFHREFKNTEQVALVLKTYKYGVEDVQVHKAMDEMIHSIKKDMKLYPNIADYHKEIVINQYMLPQDLLKLHKSCDCFVMPSYGEAICLPAADAAMIGNPVIGSDTGGLPMYSTYRINGRLEPVHHHNTIPGFGTARELWFSVDPLHLQKLMRQAFTSKAKSSINMQQYSIKCTASNILGIL